MFDAISKAATWDPVGLAADEPTSYSDRLKQELKLLRAGVRSVVEASQGIPTTKVDDSAALVACLKEVMQEQRDEADAAQREIKNLQRTISMLQEERRRYSTSSIASPAPPTPVARTPAPAPATPAPAPAPTPAPAPGPVAPAPPPSAPVEAEEGGDAAMALYAAKLVATAVETARAEERASASAALGEADAAYTMRVHAALERERDDARVRLTSLARTLERDGEAERSAACSTLVACLEELESGLRAQAEAHATNLQQTKQRAAVMLAKKDSALAQARSAKQPERPSRAIASVGVGTSDDGGPSEDAAAASVALLTDALASKGGEGAGLTSRFARRIAHLESALEKLREANRALEHGRSEDDKKRRALRTRLARQEKQAGGADIEYLRNVLIRWFMLPASERGALFPAIAAACAFTAVELASINKAREAQAPSGS